MNVKKSLSVLLALVMVFSVMPTGTLAATDCVVTDNVIDITDRMVYERRGLGSAKVHNIQIADADVVSATENDTVIDILLDGNTQADATVKVTFGAVLEGNVLISGNEADVTLHEGAATIDMAITGQYFVGNSFSGTVTYTLNFTLAQAPVTPPTRIVETDSKTTYSGVALDLNLKDYFSGAKSYYLIDGDERRLLDGKTYTFKSFSGGMYTLVFGASNASGECPDFVTVTIEVAEIESGAWLGITTSNGSVNFVKFTDADGNEIDGLTVALEDNNIAVSLPRHVEANGKIKAVFDLTQHDGLPFLTTKTGTSGTSAGKAVNNKFVEKTTELTNGTGALTFYLYNMVPSNRDNQYTTYTICYAIENEIPKLAEAQEEPAAVESLAGECYTLNLASVFTDADGDMLTYSVKINDEAVVDADANYRFVPELGGVYTLEFFASDFMTMSSESYKVVLTVTNSASTYDMSVLVPEDINPVFCVTSGYDENGTDALGDALATLKGETVAGYTTHTVSVPENVSLISVRDAMYGGMAIPASPESVVKLCKVQAEMIDFRNEVISGTFDVLYGSNKAVGIDGKFLLITQAEYIFTASPENTSVYSGKTETIVCAEDTDTVTVQVAYKNPKTVTTTTGAVAKLFRYQNNYFVHTAYEPLATLDNGNGTSTHYFAAEGDLSYRVSMEGKLTKAGYIKTGNSVTILHTEEDKLPTDRVDYFSATSDAAIVGDDSVLLNINQNNHLSLALGESKTIKAYRTWQIIDLTYNNHIIEPDFHFRILSGDDVVSVETIPNQPTTNGSGNWRKLTAIGEGSAIVEVVYDAIQIGGGSFAGLYGASDFSRCGLFVVTVGENVPEVDFGINGKTSAGSMVYTKANAKPWDAEFDTLYFFGESGEIELSPALAAGNITEVAVSGNQGESYLTLNATDGVYTAPIVSGNNIIRVTTDRGTAYQVVRGDRVELSMKNETHPGKPVQAGDMVSLTLVGVHTPIPKIAGTYNPGYKANQEGDGGVHLHYSFGEETVRGDGKQYNFSKEGATVKFTVPENSDKTEFILTDGYIGLGVIGVTDFPDDGESHRNIPDAGGTTRGNETTFHTRSVLPDITVSIGMLPSGNTAPYIRENAPQSVTLNLGGTYALSMANVFTDRDRDALTYTAQVNGGEAVRVEDGYFTYTPENIGTHTITLVAKDNEIESDAHTILLTVQEKSSTGSGNPTIEWDISGDEISGYVTISFTDSGKRVAGESNVTYPKALGTIIASRRVPFAEGDTVADVTLRLLDALDYTCRYTGTTKSGFYLASIGDFTLKGISYDSFGEFDAGVGSGWMITLNKTFIEYGASEFEVKSGDVIKWQYTCQFGEDIGDPFYSGSASLNKNNKTEDEKKEEIKAEQKEETDQNTFTEATFADVKKDDWHYESVKYVYEHNLMQGTDNGFEPESKMTRAMLVTVLYRMAKAADGEYTHAFADVPKGEWYADAIAWAAFNGIVSGITATEFAPDSDVSREQMALLFYRFAKVQNLDVSGKADISGFADADAVSKWASDALAWANDMALVNGTSETTLSPKDSATRAQVAAMLMRFCENVAK